MSLTVYLMGNEKEVSCECLNCGDIHKKYESDEFYSANITHNLTEMAGEAGIYRCLWRPEEVGINKGKDLIAYLSAGLELLKSDPARFKLFDSPNGWGSYARFVPWVEEYLKACQTYPEARVIIWR